MTYDIIRNIIWSISQLHDNLPDVPFVTGLVMDVSRSYMTQKVLLSIIWGVVAVAFEVSVVLAVFGVIDVFGDEEGLVVVAVVAVVVFVVGVIEEEAASEVFIPVVVFAGGGLVVGGKS